MNVRRCFAQFLQIADDRKRKWDIENPGKDFNDRTILDAGLYQVCIRTFTLQHKWTHSLQSGSINFVCMYVYILFTGEDSHRVADGALRVDLPETSQIGRKCEEDVEAYHRE
jgi:hypothetical protein